MAQAMNADLGGGYSRTPAGTIPEEMKRQAGRVDQQVTNLNKILDTVSNDLLEMSTKMANFSPDLVSQINNLRSVIEAYKGKSATIYGEVSNALNSYATSLSVNLTDLSNGISNVSSIVNGL